MLEQISARVQPPLVEREGDDRNDQPLRRAADRRPSIVVGVDFTPHSRRALDRAIDVACSRRARLHLLHVTPDVGQRLARAVRAEHVERRVREAMAELGSEVRASGIATTFDVSEGSLPQVMQRKARELDAELVVVGARGRLLPDAIFGSSGERIAAVARRPVLVVRRAMTRSYARLVAAIEPRSDLKRIAAAARRVASGARMKLIHAYEGPYENGMILDGTAASEMRLYRTCVRDEARDALVQAVTEAGLDPRDLVMRHGSPWHVLALEEREHRDSGTLFVLAPRRSIVQDLVFGSVTRWMLTQGQSDVLLV